MASKFRIAIIGIGGVGGYLGGRLAAKYAGSPDVEVIFIARGKNAEAIKSNGLKLVTVGVEEIVHPALVVDEPQSLGIIDLLICCVKGYGLEDGLWPLKACIGKNTIILPFLNGLDAAVRIAKIFPEADVWEGCAYIISKLAAPGVVTVSNTNSKFYFGKEHRVNETLKKVLDIFTGAGIDAYLSNDISQVLWEKFLYISPFATVTAGFDTSIGGILENAGYKETIMNLQKELKAVAEAKGIVFPEGIIQNQLERMSTLPYDSSSSMHNDFKNGNKTELNSLTGYVIELGNELNVPTPHYKRMLQVINEKWNLK
jgi:2-dehydropantoate 2-reductase